MRQAASPSVSVLPAKECSGKVRWRPGSSGSQLSPSLPLPFLPPQPKAKEKLMRAKKSAAHLPPPSRQLRPQAQVLNQKWKAETLGRRGRGPAARVLRPPHPSPAPSSSFPGEAVSPSPSACQGQSPALCCNEFSNT